MPDSSLEDYENKYKKYIDLYMDSVKKKDIDLDEDTDFIMRYGIAAGIKLTLQYIIPDKLKASIAGEKDETKIS